MSFGLVFEWVENKDFKGYLSYMISMVGLKIG